MFEHTFDASRSIILRGHLNTFNYEGDYPYDNGAPFFTESSDGRSLGGEVRFDWHTGASNRVVAGLELVDSRRADYRAWEQGESLFAGDYPFRTMSLYLQDQYQATRDLALVVGLRADDASHVAGALSPRAAVIYHATDSATIKLLYGAAYRAPNIFELYYEELDVVKPNPDLDAETIRMGEVVWEQRLGEHVGGVVSAYHYTFDRLIDSVEDPEDGMLQSRNTDAADGRGIEAEIRAHAMRYGGTLSYAWQRSTGADDRRLSNSPSHILRGHGYLPIGRSLRAAASTRYESGRRTVYDTSTDGFLIADAVLHVDLTSMLRGGSTAAIRTLMLSLKLRNLFDTDYSYPGGFEHEQDSIRQTGRTLSVALRTRL